MSDKRHMVVAVKALLVRGGRALVLRRSAGDHTAPGMWEFPGGKLEFGEGTRQGLLREIAEETGLDATVQRLLYAETVMNGDDRHIIVICYLCAAGKGDVALSFEHQDYHWATKAELRSLLDADILHNLSVNGVLEDATLPVDD